MAQRDCPDRRRLNTISLRRNSQDSLVVDRLNTIPSEYWRVLVTIGAPEWRELLNYLPEDHPLRVRLATDGDLFAKREPDNPELRSALASGISIEGAKLRRGHHVRLT